MRFFCLIHAGKPPIDSKEDSLALSISEGSLDVKTKEEERLSEEAKLVLKTVLTKKDDYKGEIYY